MTGGRVLLIGAGDAGFRIAEGLLQGGHVSHLTLADANPARIAGSAAMLACCHDAEVVLRPLDGLDHAAVTRCLRDAAPDAVVQAASLISPWSIIGRGHPTARALSAAGIAVQAPAQLPILLNVMRAVRDLGLDVPVANLSMPDIAHPILAPLGLAPTIGLGNASILHLRARAALRARGTGAAQVRVIGHHHHVYEVMTSVPPPDAADAPMVFIDTRRDGELAYEGPPVAPGQVYNVITAASAVPVVAALLPGAAPLRFSAPAPLGLPGGYPVAIDNATPALDLPDGIGRDEAVAFNRRIGRLDGVETIEGDGTLVFTAAAQRHLAGIDPGLAAALRPRDLTLRTRQLLAVLGQMGQGTGR